jgi:hypothetical protein
MIFRHGVGVWKKLLLPSPIRIRSRLRTNMHYKNVGNQITLCCQVRNNYFVQRSNKFTTQNAQKSTANLRYHQGLSSSNNSVPRPYSELGSEEPHPLLKLIRVIKLHAPSHTLHSHSALPSPLRTQCSLSSCAREFFFHVATKTSYRGYIKQNNAVNETR